MNFRAPFESPEHPALCPKCGTPAKCEGELVEAGEDSCEIFNCHNCGNEWREDVEFEY